MTQVRFGIIGCGGAAVPVCEALAETASAKLFTVYDIDPSLARDLAERYSVSCVETLDGLLNQDIDAIYIAAPHDQLSPLTCAALTAGKHVLVEKPMALTLNDADDLIALSDAKRLRLGVFYEMRCVEPYRQARALIRGGVIGKVIGVRIQTLIDKPLTYWQSGYAHRSANPWRGQKARAGGGVVLMNTSHQLDAMRWLTGLEIVRVSASIATLTAGVEVEDIATAALTFDNGALGSIIAMAHAVGAQGGHDERFDIFGTQGQVRLPDPYGEGALRVYLRQPQGDIPAGKWHTLPTRPVKVYQEAIEGFAGAILRDESAPASGRDARQVLSTVLAIYQSAAEGRSIECT
jgi:predicted dehydrogenase